MSEYQKRLGSRLRAIRQQQGLTLQQVEEISGGKWKAVVVGSYERGDRAVAWRNWRSCRSSTTSRSPSCCPRRTSPAPRRRRCTPAVMLDLRQLSRGDLDPELRPVSRFAHTIQLQRGDYNGNVLTIRGEDLRALSVIYGTDPEDLVSRLEDEGILATAGVSGTLGSTVPASCAWGLDAAADREGPGAEVGVAGVGVGADGGGVVGADVEGHDGEALGQELAR